MRGINTSAFVIMTLAVLGCDGGGVTSEGLDAAQAQPSTAGLISVQGDLLPIVLSVWQGSDGQAWFSGGGRGEIGGFIGRTDSARLVYEPVEEGRTIWWIWGTEDRARYAAGEGGRILERRDDGWRVQYRHSDHRAVFWGGWSSAAGTTWVVGGSHGTRGPKGLLLRRADGGEWERIETAEAGVTGNLFKVWGRDDDDVYMVGEGGVALHWNGATLVRVPTETEELLFTLHGNDAGEVLVVGGTRSAKILRLSGERFVDDGAPEGQPPLNGVFVQPNGGALAVGGRGLVLERDAEGVWSRRRDEVLRGLDRYTLHAVSGAPAVWAVGGDFSAGRDGLVLTSLAGSTTGILGEDKPVLEAPGANAMDAGVVDSGGLDAFVPDSSIVVDAAASPKDVEGVDAEARADVTAVDSGTQVLDAAPAPDVAAPRCGDGHLDEGEACDDGNLVDGDGCSAVCSVECGDGRVSGAEDCDDGGRANGDGCDAECRLECGNGVVDQGEECDDGAIMPGDGCDQACQLECGDGIVGLNEECDDGGREGGDGCDAECRRELVRAGQGCEEQECVADLECLGVAIDDFYPVCTALCIDVDDCRRVGFDEPVRCDLIGPQLIDTYCVPERCYEGGCQ